MAFLKDEEKDKRKTTSGNVLQNIIGPGGREFFEAKSKVKDAYREGGVSSALGIGLRETPRVLAATIRDIITPEPLRRGLGTLVGEVGEVGRAAVTGKAVPTLAPQTNNKQMDNSQLLSLSQVESDIGKRGSFVPGKDGESQWKGLQGGWLRDESTGKRYMVGADRGDTMYSVDGAGEIDNNFKERQLSKFGTRSTSPYAVTDSTWTPEETERFNRQPERIGNDAREQQKRQFDIRQAGVGTGRSFGPTSTRQNVLQQMPSKEGMSRHQYQQLLINKGSLDVQKARNLGLLEEQKLQDESVITAQGMKNQQDIATQEVLQNRARIKNEQVMKDRNVKRLKERNALLQERLNPAKFLGSKEEYAALQAEASKAATEYERALGAGTTGKSDKTIQGYL